MVQKKIKIIHVTVNLESGGSQRLLVDLVTHSDKKQFEHKIICIKNGGLFESVLKKNNIKYWILNKKFPADILTLYKTHKIIKKEQPDIVMTHIFGGHLYGRIAAKLAGIKTIVAREDNIHLDEGFIKKNIRRFLAKNLKGVVAISNDVKNWIQKHDKIPCSRTTVIHNAIDLSRFKPKKTSGKNLTKAKEIIIGTVATFKEQKGHKFLVEAFHQITKIYPQAKLWLVGGSIQYKDDRVEKETRELVKNLNIENKVKFWGDRNDIPELLNKMDIFVLPSLYEGFAIVILEAWTSKLPIIASRLKCIEEYADNNKNILFVQPWNKQEISKNIESLIKNKKLKERISSKGFETVKNFSIEKTTRKYEDFFKKMLN